MNIDNVVLPKNYLRLKLIHVIIFIPQSLMGVLENIAVLTHIKMLMSSHVDEFHFDIWKDLFYTNK